MKETILKYLCETYRPEAVLLYGSYADGTNDPASDFDCMVITQEKTRKHDDSIVAGVRLDCWLFTPEEVRTEPEDTFLTAHDAVIPVDSGIGAELKERVRRYAAAHSRVSEEDCAFLRSWIGKTCTRVRKGDDEGNFRAIAMLSTSLEDYCTLRGRFYFGSKKTIAQLRRTDETGYALFHAAISGRTNEQILAWMAYVAKE